MRFFAGHGFVPVGFSRVRVNLDVSSRIWKYQSAASTADSLRVAELVCDAGDSLLVLFRSSPSPGEPPASVRLTELKGPSDPRRRREGQLRAVLRSPSLSLVLVHSCDEPLDLIREIGILAARDAARLYSVMAAPAPEDVSEELGRAIDELDAEIPAHDLDPDRAVARTVRLLRQPRPDDAGRAAAVRALHLLAAATSGRRALPWQPFSESLAAAGLAPSDWDALLIADAYIEHDIPGVSRVVGA